MIRLLNFKNRFYTILRSYFFKRLYGLNSKNILIEKNVELPSYENIKTLKIGDYFRINSYSVLRGRNISIGNNCFIDRSVEINTRGGYFNMGDNSSINSFSKISCKGGVTIGKGVRIGSHFSLVASSHNFKDCNKYIYEQGISYQGVIIGNNVWIGTHVTILDGVTVGDNCIIAAGAVVNRNVNNNTIVGGVPVKYIKSIW